MSDTNWLLSGIIYSETDLIGATWTMDQLVDNAVRVRPLKKDTAVYEFDAMNHRIRSDEPSYTQRITFLENEVAELKEALYAIVKITDNI